MFRRCDMAFIEPMHRNKPNITYLLAMFRLSVWCLFDGNSSDDHPICPQLVILVSHHWLKGMPEGHAEWVGGWSSGCCLTHQPHKFKKPFAIDNSHAQASPPEPVLSELPLSPLMETPSFPGADQPTLRRSHRLPKPNTRLKDYVTNFTDVDDV